MNMYAIAAVVLTIAQMLLAGLGLYGLYRSMKGVRAIGRCDSKEQVLNAWARQALWALGMAALLLLASAFSLFSSINWPAIVLVCMALLGLGGVQTGFALRRVSRGQSIKSAAPEATVQEVVVRSLVPNRIRGIGDDGQPLYFTEDDLKDFQETRGVVQMLANRVAMTYRAGPQAMVPLFSFENHRGASFVLYQDDVVEVAA